jgi:hypothetical protein
MCSFGIKVDDAASTSTVWNLLFDLTGDQGNIRIVSAANQNCILRSNVEIITKTARKVSRIVRMSLVKKSMRLTILFRS